MIPAYSDSSLSRASPSSGSSASNQIELPLTASGTYDFLVEWGDGAQHRITSHDQAQVRRTYSGSGERTITIRGQIEGWRFANTGDRLKLLEISAFGPLRLGNDEEYFRGAANLTITATDVLDLTGTTSLRSAFSGCSSLSTVPSMNDWDVSQVTDMAMMFSMASSFNQPIGDWDVSSVTTMMAMFQGASSFNQPIGDWNTESLTQMSSMFSLASSFNQPIGDWDTSGVTSFFQLFSSAGSFNQPIGDWDTSNVTSLHLTFQAANAFNQNINGWDVSSVTTMYRTFRVAQSFNQPLDNWDVSSVANMSGTFMQAFAFNQDISGWDTSGATNMTEMFRIASVFNQDLSSWCVSQFGSQPTDFDTSANNWSAPRPNWGADCD